MLAGSNCRERSRLLLDVVLFLLAVAVALHELVHATCGVDVLLLAGEAGVRGVGVLEPSQRIGLTVDVDGLLGVNSAASDENLLVRHVLESNLAIVAGMDIFLHFSRYIFKMLNLQCCGGGKRLIFCNGVQRYNVFLEQENFFFFFLKIRPFSTLMR